MPANPRRSDTWRTTLSVSVVVGIVAALLGCCCGAGIMALALDSSDRGQSRPLAGPAATASPAEQPEPLVDLRMGDGADLLAHLLAVPAGAQVLDVVGSTVGVYTLEQYAAKQYPKNPEAADRLRYRGFAAAAERAWVDPGRVETRIQLVQFRSGWGAEGYYASTVPAQSPTGVSGGRYAIEIRGGAGAASERAAPEAGGLGETVATARLWNAVLRVTVLTPGQFDREAVRSLVNAQVDRIRP